ncbi:MAG: transporter ATP-binding protein [Chloroflexi bacterium]|nr:transporter ATP-binding protein [Chloroflexota bacterium]
MTATPRHPVQRLRIRVGTHEVIADQDHPMTIGRATDSDLRVDDTRVSRRHLTIRREAANWIVEDAGSLNGTYREGVAIVRVVVLASTRLLLGDGEDGVPVDLLLDAQVPEAGVGSPGKVGAGREGAAVDLGQLSVSHQLVKPVHIGRAQENDIVLSDLSVSRHHAVVHGDVRQGWEIADLGSHNGTFVNGQRVMQARLSDGDIVVLGKQVLQLTPDGLAEFTGSGEVAFEARSLLVRTRDGTVLLDEVSFAVEPRCLVAVVGTSGAGKSTLLNALAGFRPAQEGVVLFGGRDLYEQYDEIRQYIGYVPQQDILHAQLTVRRALLYGAELRFPPDVPAPERERRVEEVMAELSLSERAELRISELSGGQRKRTSIALELLTKPALLFLDEPTSGLDPGMEKALMALLRRLSDGGRTVIVVTHSVQSLELCDRVLVLAPGGRTAYFGPPREALEYFRQKEFADVFSDLEQNRDIPWKARFEQSAAHRRFVRVPLARSALPDRAVREPGPPPPRHWGRQVSTLIRRYLSVITSDRVNLAIIMLQAPILGTIILAAVDHNGFRGGGRGPLGAAQQATLFLVISATYLGAGNAIREIVKELPIYQRERSVGLSISAYLASKVIVLCMITILQTLVLVSIGAAGQGEPPSAAALGSAWLEVYIAIALSGLAAMTAGLLVSAAVRNADKALTLLPLLLVPQLVLASPQLKVDEKPVLAQAAYAASAQWGYSALASTFDSNRLAKASEAVTHTPADHLRSAWNHDEGAWLVSIVALLGLCCTTVVGAGCLLRRRDPSVLGSPVRRTSAGAGPNPNRQRPGSR